MCSWGWDGRSGHQLTACELLVPWLPGISLPDMFSHLHQDVWAMAVTVPSAGRRWDSPRPHRTQEGPVLPNKHLEGKCKSKPQGDSTSHPPGQLESTLARAAGDVSGYSLVEHCVASSWKG